MSDLFIDADILPQPFDKKEIYVLFEEMKNGNRDARDRIIKHNIRLVLYEVKKLNFTIYDQKELVSVGILGLIKAVDTFDTKNNVAFSTYASRCIDNEILMFLRKQRKLQIEESLEKSIYNFEDNDDIHLIDFLKDDSLVEDEFIKGEIYQIIRNEVNKLPKRDRDILICFFGFFGTKKLSQVELAKKYNLSQSYLSRMIKKNIKIIENALIEQGVIDKNVGVEILIMQSKEINRDLHKENSKKNADGVVLRDIQEKVTLDDYHKLLDALNYFPFSELLKKYSYNELVIAILRLGYIDNKCFSITAISEFLQIDSKKVILIIRKTNLISQAKIQELAKNGNKLMLSKKYYLD